MTNATYEALANGAIAEVERLLSLGVCTEDIVIVMTRNVYSEAIDREYLWYTDILPEATTACAKFYGYNVGIINKDTETMFKAAAKGMKYYTGMTVGDTIIVNEDARVCCLFTLENTMPVRFTDTGLTVRFEIGPPVTSADRPIDYGGIALDDMPFFEGSASLLNRHEFDQYAGQLDQWVSAMATKSLADMDFDLFLKTVQNAPWVKSDLRPKPKLRPPKEAELGDGDTKELDDFLNSFAKKGALESAT